MCLDVYPVPDRTDGGRNLKSLYIVWLATESGLVVLGPLIATASNAPYI